MINWANIADTWENYTKDKEQATTGLHNVQQQ